MARRQREGGPQAALLLGLDLIVAYARTNLYP